MKLWIDDVRPAPEGYIRCKSVNDAKNEIINRENATKKMIEFCRELDAQGSYDYADEVYMAALNGFLTLIDIDHDAGDYASDGGDYIKLLDWLEETGRNYPIHIHSQNPVGIENMRRIIQRNGWKEV